MGSNFHNILLYADDSVLLAKKQSTLIKLVQAANNLYRDNGLKLSLNKCEVINCSESIEVDGHELILADSYKYLGVLFNSDGIDYDANANHYFKNSYMVV